MSDNLEFQLIEDRMVRNAAKAVLRADIAHIKADLRGKGLGARVGDRVTEGAVDVLEQATALADDNKGVLATLVAAVVIWFARNPILDLFDAGETGLHPDDGELADQYDGRTGQYGV